MYSAFPAYGVGRPTLLEGRDSILRTMIQNGMSILLQGDQHLRFVGKKYIQTPGDNTVSGINIVPDVTGVGIWPVTMSGAYVARIVTYEELPGATQGTHYLLASGATQDQIAAGMMITFYGDAAYIEVAENGDGTDTGTNIVFSTTIWRNPGV